MGDGQWLTRCVNDNTADKTDTKSDSTDVAEVDADDKLNSREKSKVLCWDEMCEAFPDKDGDTVLHLAVLHAVSRLPDVVRLLGLQREVNWRNRLYQTPLHLAVLTANTQAAAALLALGASLSAQDSHGNTPLHTACQRNDLHTLNALLHDVRSDGWDGAVAGSASKTDDYTARTEALGSDDHDEEEEEEEEEERGVARQRRGREVRAALCTRNYEGFTCLHLAVLHRAHDLVTLLLRHGADVNAMDAKSGRTALHFAVDSTSPSLSVISTLLRQPHLRINATNFAQQTALELARGRNHLDLVDLLHVHGAEWSNRIHGYYSSDSFSEDDMEGELCGPYDDICVAGQLVSNARLR